MSTYMRFTNKCTFKTPTFTTTPAGQKVPSSYTTKEAKCVFLYLATDNKNYPTIEDEDIVEVIVDDSLIPSYDDQIVNIKDRYGDIIEAGPLEIISIRKYVGYTGKRHHYRLRTRKLRNC